jgi:hypothetical protein
MLRGPRVNKRVMRIAPIRFAAPRGVKTMNIFDGRVRETRERFVSTVKLVITLVYWTDIVTRGFVG